MSSKSTKDFIHKLAIAQKEDRENAYWLHLLKDSRYVELKHYDQVIQKCNALLKIVSIII